MMPGLVKLGWVDVLQSANDVNVTSRGAIDDYVLKLVLSTMW
jgi:hypothetical protein